MEIFPIKKKGNIKTKLTKKRNNIYKKNISKNNKKIYIIEDENYNFQNNFKLKGIKTNKDNRKNKYKNNIVNYKIRNNKPDKEKMKKEKNDRKVNNLKYLNKDSTNNKKKSLDNKSKNLKIKRYDDLSYAKRHKSIKEFKKKYYFLSKNDKEIFINNNVLIERTLPQMFVLNDYGMINDDDYEFYKKLVGSSPVKNKRIIKIKC